MITKDSTYDEIKAFVNDYSPEFVRISKAGDTRWNIIKRASENQSVSMLYESSVMGVTVWDVRYTEDKSKKMIKSNNFLVIPVARDKYQFVSFRPFSHILIKFTNHFFERYRERMHLNCDEKQAVRTWSRINWLRGRIYYKESTGAFVEAVPEGLVLGKFDKQLDMPIYCTFVSYSMLKPTQRAAFNSIENTLWDVAKQGAELMDRGYNRECVDNFMNENYHDARVIAEEIYLQYYNKDLR